jgi:hypothetical protein
VNEIGPLDMIPPQPTLDRLKTRSVMICTPIARAPAWQYTVALAETCVLLHRLGISFGHSSVVGVTNLPAARNMLAARFLASGATDLMFIDDDVGWDSNDVVRLLASDQPLIAGITRKKTDKFDDVAGWGCEFLPGESFDMDASGNIMIARAATGFMRVHRRVFEEMIGAHPEWKRADAAGMSPAEQQFYHRFFAYDDKEQTEDYVFCDRWREIGGRVFIDPNLRLSHVGVKSYTGAICELIQTLEQQRQFSADPSLRLSGTFKL